MFRRIRITIQYLKDREVPFVKKLLILGSLLYLIFPADIVPDFIIGLGIIDDITILSFIWYALKSEINDYEVRKRMAEDDKPRIIPFEGKRKKDE